MALHEAVYKIERQLEEGDYVTGTFLDIEGAFSNTPPEVIGREALKYDVCTKTAGGLDSEYAAVQAPLNRMGRHQNRRKDIQGLPAGGVPSPTLLNMVVDALQRRSNDKGFYSLGFADDFMILLRGAHLDTLMGLTSSALHIVEL